LFQHWLELEMWWLFQHWLELEMWWINPLEHDIDR